MTHRRRQLTAVQTVVVMSQVLTVFLANAIVLSQTVPIQEGEIQKLEIATGDAVSIVIHGNPGLRSACAVGALLGATCFIMLLPSLGFKGPETVYSLCAKFFAAMFSGVLFTPIVIHRMSIEVNLDYVVGVSGAISLVFVALVQIVAPIARKLAPKYIKQKMGLDENGNE